MKEQQLADSENNNLQDLDPSTDTVDTIDSGIETPTETTISSEIIVDQEKLAWGAYDTNGQLVKWGPISSGSDKCSDNSSPTCRTLTGIFDVFSMEDERCKSNIFPVGKGGAKMPYCMYFHNTSKKSSFKYVL